MSRSIKKGSIDQTEYFLLVDDTTGAPKTGVTLTDIDLTYTRTRAAHVKQDASALGSADASHADWSVFEVSSTEAPGLYRADFPDAAYATGTDAVRLGMTAPDCLPAFKEVILIDADASDLADIETAVTSGTVNANLVSIAGGVSGVFGFAMAARSITVGTCDTGGTTTTLTTKTLDPIADDIDQFKGQVLAFDRDTTTLALRGQKTTISANSASTDTETGAGASLTFTALTVAPAEDDTFTIQ